MELELKQDELERPEELAKENVVEKTIDEEKEMPLSHENGVDATIQNVTKYFEKNVDVEVAKLPNSSPVWEKISQSNFKEIVKFVVETSLKVFLKKKLNINFSTFNDMKNAVGSALDGNMKDALKKASDAALDQFNQVDAMTKTAIKGVKNNVIDHTINTQKYEIINRQTKVVNRISDNCQKFHEALAINDATTIKNKAIAIQKDMKQILPIRETIQQAQIVLDQYELWKNNGNQTLSLEENELIEKLHKTA